MNNLKSSRQIRGDEPVENAPVPAGNEAPVRGGATFSKYKPYLGSDSLTAVPNGAKFSTPLYEVARSGRRYKLLRYRRSAYGVQRDVVRIIEPQNKNKPQDRILLQALKKAGIPGAH